MYALERRKEAALHHAGELMRFGTTGMLAAFVHLSILWLLTEHTQLWYLPSSVIGFSVAFVLSFTLQKYWTFRDTDRARMSEQIWWFLFLQTGGLMTGTVGLYILVEFFGVWYLAAQALLLIVVAGATYLLSKFVIFRERKAERGATSYS